MRIVSSKASGTWGAARVGEVVILGFETNIVSHKPITQTHINAGHVKLSLVECSPIAHKCEETQVCK